MNVSSRIMDDDTTTIQSKAVQKTMSLAEAALTARSRAKTTNNTPAATLVGTMSKDPFAMPTAGSVGVGDLRNTSGVQALAKTIHTGSSRGKPKQPKNHQLAPSLDSLLSSHHGRSVNLSKSLHGPARNSHGTSLAKLKGLAAVPSSGRGGRPRPTLVRRLSDSTIDTSTTFDTRKEDDPRATNVINGDKRRALLKRGNSWNGLDDATPKNRHQNNNTTGCSKAARRARFLEEMGGSFLALNKATAAPKRPSKSSAVPAEEQQTTATQQSSKLVASGMEDDDKLMRRIKNYRDVVPTKEKQQLSRKSSHRRLSAGDKEKDKDKDTRRSGKEKRSSLEGKSSSSRRSREEDKLQRRPTAEGTIQRNTSIRGENDDKKAERRSSAEAALKRSTSKEEAGSNKRTSLGKGSAHEPTRRCGAEGTGIRRASSHDGTKPGKRSLRRATIQGQQEDKGTMKRKPSIRRLNSTTKEDGLDSRRGGRSHHHHKEDSHNNKDPRADKRRTSHRRSTADPNTAERRSMRRSKTIDGDTAMELKPRRRRPRRAQSQPEGAMVAPPNVVASREAPVADDTALSSQPTKRRSNARPSGVYRDVRSSQIHQALALQEEAQKNLPGDDSETEEEEEHTEEEVQQEEPTQEEKKGNNNLRSSMVHLPSMAQFVPTFTFSHGNQGEDGQQGTSTFLNSMSTTMSSFVPTLPTTNMNMNMNMSSLVPTLPTTNMNMPTLSLPSVSLPTATSMRSSLVLPSMATNLNFSRTTKAYSDVPNKPEASMTEDSTASLDTSSEHNNSTPDFSAHSLTASTKSSTGANGNPIGNSSRNDASHRIDHSDSAHAGEAEGATKASHAAKVRQRNRRGLSRRSLTGHTNTGKGKSSSNGMSRSNLHPREDEDVPPLVLRT